MNIDFEFPLNENKDIVFRIDKLNTNLFEVAKLKQNDESYAYNAIRFKIEKIRDLYNLIEIGLKTPKSDTSILTTRINGTQVRILNYFGTFNAEFKNYLFTFTDWGNSEKYDFHPWYNNYTECDKGIRLTEDECRELLTILRFLLHFEETKR